MNDSGQFFIVITILVIVILLAIGLFIILALPKRNPEPPSIPSIPEILPFGACTSSSDCPAPQICSNNTCINPKPCLSNSQCNGLLCKGGLCVPCKAGVDIVPNYTCVNGTLLPSLCNTEEDCANGAACIQGYCVPKGKVESKGVRQEIRNVLESNICVSDAQCLNGTHCSQGQCITNCTEDDECPQSQICLNGRCRRGCGNNTECPPGSICEINTGRCIPTPRLEPQSFPQEQQSFINPGVQSFPQAQQSFPQAQQSFINPGVQSFPQAQENFAPEIPQPEPVDEDCAEDDYFNQFSRIERNTPSPYYKKGGIESPLQKSSPQNIEKETHVGLVKLNKKSINQQRVQSERRLIEATTKKGPVSPTGIPKPFLSQRASGKKKIVGWQL